METIDIIMLIGLVLMITALVLMYKCVRGKACHRRIERLADSVASDKEYIDFLVKRFGCLFEEMSADHGKESVLKEHAARLQELVEELECQQYGLEADNRSMTDINNELKRGNAELVQSASRLRDEISCNEQTIRDMEKHIDSLKKIREGLEIALNNLPAEEVHYLSEPVFSLGVTPSIRSHLEAHGILYIGDLIHLDDSYIMEIWGVGPITLEKIKNKLNENGVRFGMDVIRVGNHWYCRKQELTTD